MPSARLFVTVALLFVILIGLGWWAADVQALQMQRWLASGHLPPIGNPWKGTSNPNFDYYMTINAIFISIVLLIPAISAFVLRRPGGPGPVWLMFWTAAWLAFLVHLYYGIDHVLHGIGAVFSRHRQATARHQPDRGHDRVAVVDRRCHPGLGASRFRPTWVQIERGVLHGVLFVSALVSSIVLSSNGYVRAAGIVLLVIALICALYRVVVYPFDPTSAAGRLYTLSFQALNLYRALALPLRPGVRCSTSVRCALCCGSATCMTPPTVPVTNPAGLSTPPRLSIRLYLTQRNLDGYYNDLSKPDDGQRERSRADRREQHVLHQEQSGRPFRPQHPARPGLPRAGAGADDAEPAAGQHGASGPPRRSSRRRR